eukprot:Nk52_evm1s324 gene=Nk52_evmTU1s324
MTRLRTSRPSTFHQAGERRNRARRRASPSRGNASGAAEASGTAESSPHYFNNMNVSDDEDAENEEYESGGDDDNDDERPFGEKTFVNQLVELAFGRMKEECIEITRGGARKAAFYEQQQTWMHDLDKSPCLKPHNSSVDLGDRYNYKEELLPVEEILRLKYSDRAQKQKKEEELESLFSSIEATCIPLRMHVFDPSQMFGWDSFKNKILCPECNPRMSSATQNKGGRLNKLGGWSGDRPRRVVAVGSQYFLTSKILKCDRCNATFSAHKDEVMNQLPIYVQNEFPAVITHKRAIDKLLLYLANSLIGRGVSPEILAAGINETMYAHYLDRKATYYSLAENGMFNVPKFMDEKDFGYQPVSGAYIRHVFKKEKRKTVDQKTCDLAAVGLKENVFAVDISVKVPWKNVLKANGVRVTESYVTLVCGDGKIRSIVALPGMSLSHSELVFEDISHLYKQLSASGPVYMYSDDARKDTSFLTKVFRNVHRDCTEAQVLQNSLPKLNLGQCIVQYARGPFQASTFYLAQAEDIDLRKPVGFDVEWKPDAKNDFIDVIQLAFSLVKGGVFILVYQLTSGSRSLSRDIFELLVNINVTKYGVGVAGDLARIRRASNFQNQSQLDNLNQSVVDLRPVAKVKGAIENTGCSLAYLLGVVKSLDIDKFESARMSDWSVSPLHNDQVQYAAVDAYACLLIAEALNSMPAYVQHHSAETIRKLAQNTLLALRNGQQTLAYCKYKDHRDERNSCRVTVEVTKVLVPNARLPPHRDNRKRTYGDLNNAETITCCPSELSGVPLVNARLLTADATEEGVVQVLQDLIHAVARLPVSKKHSLYHVFINGVLEACQLRDEEDMAAFTRYVHSISDDLKSYFTVPCKRDMLNKHVRWYMQKKEIVFEQIDNLVTVFGSLDRNTPDNVSSPEPLFLANFDAEIQKFKDLFTDGYLSDPADVPLYILVKRDKKKGLNVYRCKRGTNKVEGSAHSVFKNLFHGSSTDPEFMDLMLLEFLGRINLKVDRLFNEVSFKGYETHKVLQIMQMAKKLNTSFRADYVEYPECIDWSEICFRSSEKVGNCRVTNKPIYGTFNKEQYALLEQRPAFEYLAFRQNTKSNILPVNGLDEMKLYTEMMKDSQYYTTSHPGRALVAAEAGDIDTDGQEPIEAEDSSDSERSGSSSEEEDEEQEVMLSLRDAPFQREVDRQRYYNVFNKKLKGKIKWTAFATDWCNKADGKAIFLKFPCQLKGYFVKWCQSQRRILSMKSINCFPLLAHIRNGGNEGLATPRELCDYPSIVSIAQDIEKLRIFSLDDNEDDGSKFDISRSIEQVLKDIAHLCIGLSDDATRKLAEAIHTYESKLRVCSSISPTCEKQQVVDSLLSLLHLQPHLCLVDEMVRMFRPRDYANSMVTSLRDYIQGCAWIPTKSRDALMDHLPFTERKKKTSSNTRSANTAHVPKKNGSGSPPTKKARSTSSPVPESSKSAHIPFQDDSSYNSNRRASQSFTTEGEFTFESIHSSWKAESTGGGRALQYENESLIPECFQYLDTFKDAVKGWGITQDDIISMYDILSTPMELDAVLSLDNLPPRYSLLLFDTEEAIHAAIRSTAYLDGTFISAVLNERLPEDCCVCPPTMISFVGDWIELSNKKSSLQYEEWAEFEMDLVKRHESAFSDLASFLSIRFAGDKAVKAKAILFPVLSNSHFWGLVANLESQRWVFFDSLSDKDNYETKRDRNQKLASMLFRLYGKANDGDLFEIFRESNPHRFKLPIQSLPGTGKPRAARNGPQQRDGFSCAMICMFWFDHYARKVEPKYLEQVNSKFLRLLTLVYIIRIRNTIIACNSSHTGISHASSQKKTDSAARSKNETGGSKVKGKQRAKGKPSSSNNQSSSGKRSNRGRSADESSSSCYTKRKHDSEESLEESCGNSHQQKVKNTECVFKIGNRNVLEKIKTYTQHTLRAILERPWGYADSCVCTCNSESCPDCLDDCLFA